MTRSLWNGTVAFGVFFVPVKLHSATHSETVRFKEVHAKDGSKVEHRRFCAKEDKEVPYEEVAKGFEVRDGEWVLLEKEDLKAAAGDRTHTMDLEGFVPLADLDPVVFDTTYALEAGEDGEGAYRLLHGALERTGTAGIGRFTFHDRERLVAVRAHGDVLAVHVLRFADELVPAKDVDVPAPQKPPSEREVEMAAQLVESLATDFKPKDYQDTYRQAVLDLIAAKAKGEEPPAPEEPDTEETDDLAKALQASLKGARKKTASSRKKKAAA